MALSFNFYFDAALTQPVTAETPISAAFTGAASTDLQLWFGSTASSTQVQDLTTPGTTPISISPSDSAAGSGQPDTALKLSTSQAGLDTATAGATLEIGTTVLSGVANAFPFWLRISNALTAVAVYTDLSLITSEIIESPV